MDLSYDDEIHLYDDGVWRKIYIDGPYVLEKDGVYLLYFRNSKCLECKAFDKIWIKLCRANDEYV